MKRKQLISELDSLSVFVAPKVVLEQYATPSKVATELMFLIMQEDDMDDKLVMDVGAGTGILTAASIMSGASHVIAVEVDPSAIEIGQQNLAHLDMESYVDWVQMDVKTPSIRKGLEGVDIILMNPPFGTKQQGIDIVFLQFAMDRLASDGVIYSMHKSSTRNYIRKWLHKQGWLGEAMLEVCYPLRNTYKYHKQKKKVIQVDIWRISKVFDE